MKTDHMDEGFTDEDIDAMEGRDWDWGGWHLNSRDHVLEILNESGNVRYYVDLDRCQSAAAVLDWIFQIVKKPWATDEVMAGLLHAIEDVLHPQGRLCSFASVWD